MTGLSRGDSGEVPEWSFSRGENEFEKPVRLAPKGFAQGPEQVKRAEGHSDEKSEEFSPYV